MRSALCGLALVFLAAGCGADINVSDDHDSSPAGSYTLEVRADQAAQIYLVTTPDGKTVAARAANGTSALMEGRAVQALANQPMPAGEEGQDQVSIRVPGANISVHADGDDESGNGTAHINVNAGGRHVQVDAQGNGDDNGPDNNAHVRITGADEEEARDFVRKADKLSPDVQNQMLAALGLDGDHRAAAPETHENTTSTP